MAKTPHRTVRVSDDLWEAAKAAAASEGLTLSEVVVSCLRGFVEDHEGWRDEDADAGRG